MLKELVPYIRGPWFLGDGGLLGIVRNKKLIPYDKDLDIYLLPGSYIDIKKMNESSLKFQKYYALDKVYREDNELSKENSWLAYCSLIKGKNKKLNRAQIMKLASKTYPTEKKQVKFTSPWIDIFYLYKKDNHYYIQNEMWSHLYFTQNEIESIGHDMSLGFPINIPHDNIDILRRFYGEDWNIPIPNFQHRLKYIDQKDI